MTEEEKKWEQTWEHFDIGDYRLQLGPETKLEVNIGKDSVCLGYSDPAHREEVDYCRETGDLKTFVTTYENTPEGKVGKEKINVEPARILDNKTAFSDVSGIQGKDQKLVEIVLGFIQEQF